MTGGDVLDENRLEDNAIGMTVDAAAEVSVSLSHPVKVLH